jgi:hypothetical protein
MGSGRYDHEAYTIYASAATTRGDGSRKTAREVFTTRRIVDELDPSKATLRESCDSAENPSSRAIIIGLDVSGSMGMIADQIAGEKLGILMNGILDTQPVKDPHIMFMAIGDVNSDSAPLQVSQFEADIRIAQQLTQIYLEGGGGGNNFESYDLPWYFAATRTSLDCFKKRGEKGYLFTMGDEMPARGLTPSNIQRVFGKSDQSSYTTKELLNMAEQTYNVFHIIIEEGSYARRALQSVRKEWGDLMGDHVIYCKDYTRISEIILAVIRVNEGENPEDVISSYQDKSIQDVVRHALFSNAQ